MAKKENINVKDSRIDSKIASTISLPKFVKSEHGLSCVERELLCLRCCKTQLIVVPHEDLDLVQYGDLSGDIFLIDIASFQGWVVSQVESLNKQLYMLCPQCVKNDFDAAHRFANHFYEG